MNGIRINVASEIIGTYIEANRDHTGREIPVTLEPGEYFATFFGNTATIHHQGRKLFIDDIKQLKKSGRLRILEVMNKHRTYEYGRWHRIGYVH